MIPTVGSSADGSEVSGFEVSDSEVVSCGDEVVVWVVEEVPAADGALSGGTVVQAVVSRVMSIAIISFNCIFLSSCSFVVLILPQFRSRRKFQFVHEILPKGYIRKNKKTAVYTQRFSCFERYLYDKEKQSLLTFHEDIVNFVVGELLAAACGQHGGIRNCTEIGVFGDPQFPERGRKSAFLDEISERAYPGFRSVNVRSCLNSPDVPRKTRESRDIASANVAVQNRVNDRKSPAVVAVGECAELMLYHVRLEVGYLADFEYSIFRHRGSPHQLAACIIIIVVAQEHTDI